jgi:DNA-binding MarR family transcriptional regulator/N-acetylglutamate synthase-like GNAT family acetyltransferase
LDTIQRLGELGFASRLKRLSERLMKDVSRIYQALDVDFEARWFSILYALTKQSSMSVTTLATSLRLTHAAVNQLAGEMENKNLLVSTKDKQDERKRLLRLSLKGKEVAASLKPVWKHIRLATQEVIDQTDSDLLTTLDRIEGKLDEEDMFDRVSARMGINLGEEAEIVDYRPAYKKYFLSLNLEWIERYFKVEPEDWRLLEDPNGKIIRKGGVILFASLYDNIVGACALIRHDDGIFELTKMAVTEKLQGRGLGLKLGRAVIDRARQMGASALYLESNVKLTAALRLYQALGFKKVKDHPLDLTKYKRKTFVMKLDLHS